VTNLSLKFYIMTHDFVISNNFNYVLEGFSC